MRRAAWAVFISTLSFACGSSGGEQTDAGADAGPPACSSDLATSSQPCGTLSWETSATKSRLRNHHMTYVTYAQDGSAFLVAVAGVNGSKTMRDTDIAPIAPDGTVGAFASGPLYGAYVGGLSGANVAGVLVGAGGNTGAALVADVFTSVVQPDGSLAEWKKQAPMNVKRMHAASFAVGSRIWIMGGFDTDVHDDVISADVGADGTIAAWSPSGTLPGKRTHFSAAYARGYVYITGGIAALPTMPSPSLRDVERGTVEPDGTIDQWTKLTPLPAGVVTHASFVYGGYLYVAGGIDDSPAQLATVRRAPLQDDDTLGAWETVAPLPVARGHVHQLPIVGGHVYSVSGAIDFSLDSIDGIFVGSFQ